MILLIIFLNKIFLLKILGEKTFNYQSNMGYLLHLVFKKMKIAFFSFFLLSNIFFFNYRDKNVKKKKKNLKYISLFQQMFHRILLVDKKEM